MFRWGASDTPVIAFDRRPDATAPAVMRGLVRTSYSDVVLRSMTPADAALVASLHAASWRAAYRGILSDAYLDGPIDADRQATWQTRLCDDRSRAFGVIAEVAGMPQGFVYAIPDEDPSHGTLIDNLHVLPTARGLGLGRALMCVVAEALPAHATSSALHLHVYEANHAARAFYAHLGGREVARFTKSQPDGRVHSELLVTWPDARLLLDS
jgi:ribosomal protein S18 acetylase RimI-like enzyme